MVVAAQMILSAVAIVAYLVVQPNPDSLLFLGGGPFENTLKAAYPIPDDNVYARNMFRGLFVPLAYAQLFSMVLVAAMLPREIRFILRDLKKHGYLIIVIMLYFFGSYAMLLAPQNYVDALRNKRQILHGESFGYFMLFSSLPFSGILILLSLPSYKNPNRSW